MQASSTSNSGLQNCHVYLLHPPEVMLRQM